MATTNAQLVILPTFSNDLKEDTNTAIEWLKKLLNNKQGTKWKGSSESYTQLDKITEINILCSSI
jgi:hypothetical protein